MDWIHSGLMVPGPGFEAAMIDVGALEGLFLGVDALRVGGLADLPLAIVGCVGLHVVAALVQAALAVEHDHAVGIGPVGQEQPRGRAVRGAGAEQDDVGGS